MGRRPAQPPAPSADRGSRAVSFAVWRCRGTLGCKPSVETARRWRPRTASGYGRSFPLRIGSVRFRNSAGQTRCRTVYEAHVFRRLPVHSPPQVARLKEQPHGLPSAAIAGLAWRDRTIDEPSQSYRSIQHETIHRRPSSIRSLTVTPSGSGLPRIRMRSISANASFRLTSLRAGISTAASFPRRVIPMRSPARPAPTVFAWPRTTQYFSSHQSPREIISDD